jgi:hypothetical protein
VGVVLVMSSRTKSVAISALLLFVRPPYPTKAVTSMADAEAHCRALLKKAPAAQISA